MAAKIEIPVPEGVDADEVLQILRDAIGEYRRARVGSIDSRTESAETFNGAVRAYVVRRYVGYGYSDKFKRDKAEMVARRVKAAEQLRPEVKSRPSVEAVVAYACELAAEDGGVPVHWRLERAAAEVWSEAWSTGAPSEDDIRALAAEARLRLPAGDWRGSAADALALMSKPRRPETSRDSEFTGLYDDEGSPINVGDQLRSRHGYDVIVRRDEKNGVHGRLVCDSDHPCAHVPYHLNAGKGHVKVSRSPEE